MADETSQVSLLHAKRLLLADLGGGEDGLIHKVSRPGYLPAGFVLVDFKYASEHYIAPDTIRHLGALLKAEGGEDISPGKQGFFSSIPRTLHGNQFVLFVGNNHDDIDNVVETVRLACSEELLTKARQRATGKGIVS